MPELRQNIATREWVIIATERAKRPAQFVQPPKDRIEDRPVYDSECPFCPGNEEHDLERLCLPAVGPWQTRVVANRYPALQEDGPRERRFDGVHRTINGVGYHEVVVESRLHNTCPALESAVDVMRTIQAFQQRGQTISTDLRIEQVVYFKNHGRRAGASLAHPHAQIVALPVVPNDIRVRIQEARRNYDDHGECVYCRMRFEEEQQQQRIVVNSDYFTAFIPYAAYSPFHMWIVPHTHRASFLDASAIEIADLGYVLRTVLRKLYLGLNDPDYNYVLRSCPERERSTTSLHWYVSLVPHVTRLAGFEMGSGMFINSALPEESAAFLRAIDSD